MLLSKKSKRVEDLTYLKTNNFRVQIKKKYIRIATIEQKYKNLYNKSFKFLQISKTTPVLQQE